MSYVMYDQTMMTSNTELLDIASLISGIEDLKYGWLHC